MGEDYIERWNQIRIWHPDSVRSLHSEILQKKNQEKNESVAIGEDIKKVIENVNQKRKRNLRKNSLNGENDTLKNNLGF